MKDVTLVIYSLLIQNKPIDIHAFVSYPFQSVSFHQKLSFRNKSHPRVCTDDRHFVCQTCSLNTNSVSSFNRKVTELMFQFFLITSL